MAKVPSTQEFEFIPPMRRGQLNVYKPSDIKRWGVNRFLDEVTPKEPTQPNFNFTEEEQRRMEELLANGNDA